MECLNINTEHFPEHHVTAQRYSDQENMLALSMENTLLRKQVADLTEELAMILKSDESIKCGIDSRTNCTGCPECRA